MCKLIAIHGQRGTGRKTAAWLIASAIEDLKQKTTFDKFKIKHEARVKLVCLDANEATSTNHCILDSFGQYILDQVRALCPKLDFLGIDLHDHQLTQTTFICPNTFDITADLDKPKQILTAEEYARKIEDNRALDADIYMSVEEFIMYYAKYVMKKYFGANVWLHSIRTQNEFVGADDIRIYWDAKTQAELDYISSEHGKIIYLNCQDRARSGGYRDIKALDPDFILDTHLGLMSSEVSEQIWYIANEILK